MRDDRTGLSKEFGFVSFTRDEEAAKAQSTMDGAIISGSGGSGRPIIARFHEPKKFREARTRPTPTSGDLDDVARRLATLASDHHSQVRPDCCHLPTTP